MEKEKEKGEREVEGEGGGEEANKGSQSGVAHTNAVHERKTVLKQRRPRTRF